MAAVVCFSGNTQSQRPPSRAMSPAGPAPPTLSGCFVSAAPLVTSRALPALSPLSRRRPRSARASPPRRARVRAPTAAVRGTGGPSGGFPPPQKMADYLLRVGRFFQSSNGQLLLWAGFVWLVLSGNASIIFDSFLFILLFVTVVPVVALFAFRFWVSRQMVEGSCPNCGNAVNGMRGKPFQCMNCGQVVKGEGKNDFSWGTEPSSATIDVDAIDVDVD